MNLVNVAVRDELNSKKKDSEELLLVVTYPPDFFKREKRFNILLASI
jgi:hypothetical protein